MRSIVNRTAGKLLVVIALLTNQGCDRRAPTENYKLTPALTTPRADLSPGTLGKYQILVPPENNRSNHGGGVPYAYTGIRIPAYTAYVIAVNGRVSTTKNPAWYCQGTFSWPYDGHDYGPLGTGTNYDLLVNLRVWTFSGANTYVPVSLPGTGGASGATEVKTDTIFTWYDQDLEAGRNGIAFACDDVGGYLMSGSQTLTVEEITNTLKLTPPEYYVHPGTRVTFTASMADGSPLGTTINWAWIADSLHARSVGGICGTNANPCSVTPTVSGTVRVVGNVLGKMREAKGHVTVYTNFTLVSDSNTAHRLSDVRFTPQLDGKTAKAARWRWVPQTSVVQDSTICTADTTCVKQMTGTGTMWAYLATTGGDSASATVTLAPDSLSLTATPASVTLRDNVTFTVAPSSTPFTVDRWSYEGRTPPCGSDAHCTFAPPFSGTMWVFGTVRGMVDSAMASVVVRLADDDSTSVGTDSTAILRVRATAGLTASPATGTYVYAKGAAVSYAFAAAVGYAEMATFLDDTLTANSGSVTMTRDRTFQVAADPDYDSWPHMAELRGRLRSVIQAADKPEAFRQHIAWVADTAWTEFPTSAALDSALEIAEYLEFDPVVDRDALIAFDQAMDGQVFRLTRTSGGVVFSRTSPGDRAASLSRTGKSPTSLSTDVYPVPDSIVFTFVNGIRTLEDGAVNTKTLIEALRREAEADLPNSLTDYYWNGNLRGEILALTDSRLGCVGQGIRHLRFRQKLTAIVRIGACKALHWITWPILDDISQSAFEYANLHWSFIKDPTSDDLNHVKDLIRFYHEHDASVVFIPHSQGNMIVSQAVRDLQQEGYALQQGHCTAILALAPPIRQDAFYTDPLHLRGMTMDGDLLQVLSPLLYSDFQPRYPSTMSAEADASIASVPDLLKPLWRIVWGIRLHDVDKNYVLDANNRPVMKQFMKELNNNCRPSP